MFDKLKQFFAPTKVKIILTILLAVATLFFFNAYQWGFSPIHTPFALLFLPILLPAMIGLAGFIISLIIAYIYSSIMLSIFNRIKTNKPVLLLVAVLLFFFIGIDEPVVNATINQPNYYCAADSDCVVKSMESGICGPAQRCTNSAWNYHNPLVNGAFALSCLQPLVGCSCESNACVTHNLYRSTDITKCDQFVGAQKEECVRIISTNIQGAKLN